MTSIRRILTRRVLGLAMFSCAVAGLLAFERDEQQKPQPAPATTAERITVPFTDPARPGKLTVQLIAGSITVRGYEGQGVVVETRAAEDDDDDRGSDRGRSGLRRIPNTASGLVIEEHQNEMRIWSEKPNKSLTIVVQIPMRTALKLSTVNDGDIVVERVEGDMEVSNVNGNVTLTNVSGTGVIHSTNGELKASFLRVSGKPMSFITFNGDVDVSLPADLKATVKLDPGQGDIYTDFPLEMMPTSLQQTVEDNRSKGGKYRIKMEKAMIGRINGGGTEYTFKTYNGDIHLRRYQAGAAAKE
jgi:Putative adhesin